MKNLNVSLIVSILLSSIFFSQKNYCQENSSSEFKFGLGASLLNVTDLYISESILTDLIYLTCDFENSFRIEPSIGFAVSDDYNQYSLGLGLFAKNPLSKFDLLYGLRIGANNEKIISIAPTISGEYYFVEHFSLGSEIQLRGLINEGDWFLLPYSSVLFRFYF